MHLNSEALDSMSARAEHAMNVTCLGTSPGCVVDGSRVVWQVRFLPVFAFCTKAPLAVHIRHLQSLCTDNTYLSRNVFSHNVEMNNKGILIIIIIYTTYIAPYIWPVWPFIGAEEGPSKFLHLNL